MSCVEKRYGRARAIKLVRGMKNLSYSERLDKPGLYTLERRTLRGDLSQIYRILTGKEHVDCQQLASVNGVVWKLVFVAEMDVFNTCFNFWTIYQVGVLHCSRY